MRLVMRGVLVAPACYWDMPDIDKNSACNGCGPKGGMLLRLLSIAIPDSLLGLSIREACNIHDISVVVLKKDDADKLFYKNMMALINKRGGILAGVRRLIAKQYYNAVKAWEAY